MANRSLRRARTTTQGPSGGVSGGDSIAATTVIAERGTEPDNDRIADNDGEQHGGESDVVSHDGVVEVEPAKLGEFIQQRSAGSSDGSGDGTRTRRTRADAGIKRGKRTRKEAPQNLEAVINMVHTWASVLLKSPELMLAPEETKQLSDAYSTFCEYHEVPILTPKRMSEFNLIATGVMIYGTRIVAVARRKKEERQRKQQATPFVMHSHRTETGVEQTN